MSEYCKLCGQKFSDARNLLNNRCTKNSIPNGKHVLFEGDKDGPFICVHCGEKKSDLRNLVTNRCKYCGHESRDIRNLVTNRCIKNSTRNGHHSPAR